MEVMVMALIITGIGLAWQNLRLRLENRRLREALREADFAEVLARVAAKSMAGELLAKGGVEVRDREVCLN